MAAPKSLSSPHTRGNLFKTPALFTGLPFIPAYTGKPVCGLSAICTPAFHPRIRGETQHWTELVRAPLPFIPAYTGKPISAKAHRGLPAFHPRIHGETSLEASAAVYQHLSSPHTRGNRGEGKPSVISWAFIPAYTGKPPRRDRRPAPDTFHPRIHGETLSRPRRLRLPALSSPHTRGNPGSPGGACGVLPFIPAYTGKPIVDSWADSL